MTLESCEYKLIKCEGALHDVMPWNEMCRSSKEVLQCTGTGVHLRLRKLWELRNINI